MGGGGLIGGDDDRHGGWARGFVFWLLAYVFPTLASCSVLARAVEQSLVGGGHLQCFGVSGFCLPTSLIASARQYSWVYLLPFGP